MSNQKQQQQPLENPELLTDLEAQTKFLKEKYGFTCIPKPSSQAENYFFVFRLEDKEPVNIAYGKFDEVTFNTVIDNKRVRTRKVTFIPEDPPEEFPQKSWWRRFFNWG